MGRHFDEFTKALAAGQSRRTALRRLIGGVAAAMVAGLTGPAGNQAAASGRDDDRFRVNGGPKVNGFPGVNGFPHVNGGRFHRGGPHVNGHPCINGGPPVVIGPGVNGKPSVNGTRPGRQPGVNGRPWVNGQHEHDHCFRVNGGPGVNGWPRRRHG